MILGFSTHLNGKPTNFVEKIWKGLKENLSKELHAQHEAQMTHEELTTPYQVDSDVYPVVKAKLHTIREDKKDRWKAGTKLDFFINVRRPNMLRFAPVLPVVSIQNFQIVWYDTTDTVWEFPHLKYAVRVDKRRLEINEIETIAQNDGFDSVEDFLNYFNYDFKGKIIHWTDLKY
jgi:hypothetical protein